MHERARSGSFSQPSPAVGSFSPIPVHFSESTLHLLERKPYTSVERVYNAALQFIRATRVCDASPQSEIALNRPALQTRALGSA